MAPKPRLVGRLKFRPGAVSLILVVLFTTVFPLPATAQIQAGSGGLGAACNFLRSLMNSNLSLVVETPGSQNYNIASDNLLAYNALITVCKGVYDSVGRTINASIAGHCCNRGYDNMHEVIFDVPIRLPVNATNTYDVTDRFPSGSWKVYHENHNRTGFLSDAQYGDVAAYTGLEQEREGHHTAALHETLLLNWMYDGHGIRDDVFRFSNKPEEHGIYQTFKSALYLLALAKTDQNIPSALVSTVQSMQSSDGGFHTGYDANGNYSMTQENVETTSIAMFALVSLPNSCSWFCSYWYLVLIPIGALLLGAGLFYGRIRSRNLSIKPRLALLLLPWPVSLSS